MNSPTLSFDQWKDRYRPQCQCPGHRDPILIRPLSDEMERIYEALRKRPATIWTVVRDVSGGGLYLTPGFEMINRVGHILTEERYDVMNRHIRIDYPSVLDAIHPGVAPTS